MRDSVQLISIAAIGLLSGWYLKSIFQKEQTSSASTEDVSHNTSYKDLDITKADGEVRMALIVRSDIPMLKGKAAAQCAHAAVGCYRSISDPQCDTYNPILLNKWLQGGQAKITLKCPDLDTMETLLAQAMSLSINTELIADAGRTQIDPGTITVLGLGPCPRSILDQVTGELKLY